ncbi:hypothetical protein ACFCX0_38275 [Streptomyces sp. NPDC056352]|uniref:hypothetical protein n=1 Tax=Streptomyces sp. NPDC056352 TaxID=3345791 RepID=UPI0035DDCD47
MGGDSPLDYLDGLQEIVGVEGLYSLADMSGEQRAAVAARLADPGVLKRAQGHAEQMAPKGLQVLATVLLAVGAPIPEQLRGWIYAAIAAEDLSDWGSSADERQTHLAALRSAVAAHAAGGVVTSIADEGLFEVLLTHVAG